MNQFPISLTDGTLRLRTIGLAETEQVYSAVRESIPEISPWMDWCHGDYQISNTKDFLASREEAWLTGTDYTFGIFDGVTGAFWGCTGINQINQLHRFGNLSYWVRTTVTRQGVATRATLLTARFGFEALGLSRIEIVAMVGNAASRRVAEKAGAVYEGILRRRLFFAGQFCDAAMYSLVKGEC
ncbi:MAG: GNAT family N-acetyltransferase [Blastocatellia bacterium]|nr:GNAT family N-acetyltransferase [Blastocatellia bacterium]